MLIGPKEMLCSNGFAVFGNRSRVILTERVGKNIICILDGLDECKEDSRRLLVTSLVNYFNEGSRAHGPFLKVIVSSRPDNFIKTSFKKLPTIRLRGNLEMEASILDSGLEIESEDTEHDVKLVIDYNLQELVD